MPDTSDLKENHRNHTVSWSLDGTFLYAGGFYRQTINNQPLVVLRKYSNSGKGSFKDIPLCRDSVTDVKTLPDGRIAFSSSYPEWGVLNKDNEKLIFKKGELLDISGSENTNINKNLKINNDCDEICIKPDNGDFITFNLTQKSLLKGDSKGFSARTDYKNIVITDLRMSYTPKLNNKILDFLGKNERSYTATITPNGKNIILSTSDNLFCLDNNGKIIWKKSPLGGGPWAVNASDTLIVATFTDGTLRWTRVDNGTTLLILFIHPDLKRWIIWTPSGYYDCSPGGQELIGWHLNNGVDKEATLYPVSKFSDKYYRPDVISLILKNLDEAKALAVADSIRGTKTVQETVVKSLPPTVNIISPETNSVVKSKSVEIEYTVSTPDDSPITEIKVLINGRPAEYGERGLKVVSKNHEKIYKRITVQIDEGEQEINILAKNGNGYSEPAKIKVKFSEKVTTEGFVIQPKLYVLAIGISNYENKEYMLKYAAKDANDFVGSFVKQKGKLYKEVITKVLTDANATKDNILDGLDWLQKQVTSKDVAMLFIAGHGINDDNGRLYYLPVNAQLDNLKRTGLLAEEITLTISAIAGKVIYFMDTCHSGNVKVESKRGFGDLDLTSIINELTSSENGAIVFCSSSGKQFSLESDEWKNGAFTKALIEGITGAADYQKNGSITINELDLFISDKVKELTKGKQTPVTAKPDTIRDFPIAVK